MISKIQSKNTQEHHAVLTEVMAKQLLDDGYEIMVTTTIPQKGHYVVFRAFKHDDRYAGREYGERTPIEYPISNGDIDWSKCSTLQGWWGYFFDSRHTFPRTRQGHYTYYTLSRKVSAKNVVRNDALHVV